MKRTNKQGTTTQDSITAYWNNPTDTDFAKVQIFVNGIKVGETIDESHKFTGLVADTLYMIVVKTVDASGNVSQGAALGARTQAVPVATPPTTPTTPTIPAPPGSVIEIPMNPTPAPIGGGGGSAIITLPSLDVDSTSQDVSTYIEKAKQSHSIVDFVVAKSQVQALTDEEKRKQFEAEMDKLKVKLNIKDLPTKFEVRPALPMGISLQIAMSSESYKYIDVASIQTEGANQNVFVLNSKGERVDNVEVKVLFNRIVVMPKGDDKFDSKETYTIVVGKTVKGKPSLDSKESFELKNSLILEFTTR